MHRASIWPWPDTRVIGQVVRQTIDKMTSRWDARYLGVVLVSVRYTRLDTRATSAWTTCKRNWCGVIQNDWATSVWVMITPGRFTSTDRPNGYIDVVLIYILWSYRGQTDGRPETKIRGVGLNSRSSSDRFTWATSICRYGYRSVCR